MPKAGKRAPLENRKLQVRHEHEARQLRRLYLGLGGVLALILLIAGIGVLSENVLKLNNPIAIVNGKTISVRDYQTRLRYDASDLMAQLQQATLNLQQVQSDPTLSFLVASMQQQQQQIASQLTVLPSSDLEQLIEDEIVRQEAARRNLTVGADEVENELEKFLGYQRATPTPTAGPSPTATSTATPTKVPTVTPSPTGTITPTTPTVTPTLGPTDTPEPTPTLMTYQAYTDARKKYFDDFTKRTSVGEADVRKFVEVYLLRRKLMQVFADQTPKTEEQVQARHILVKTYDEAVQVGERLKKGEDFVKLALELSQDNGSKEEGGDLGWFPRGQMIKEFEDAAFALSVNQISQPITTSFGVHIIQALGHEQNRPLTESALQQKQTQVFTDWLQKTLLDSNTKIERFYKDEYVPADIRKMLGTQPIPQ